MTGLSPFGSGPWQAVFRRVYAGTPELGDLERVRPALARAFTAALAPELKDRLSIEDLLLVLDEIAEGGSGEAALTKALGILCLINMYVHYAFANLSAHVGATYATEPTPNVD